MRSKIKDKGKNRQIVKTNKKSCLNIILINHHEEKFQARKYYVNQRETKPKNAATSKFRFRNRSDIKSPRAQGDKKLHSLRVQVRVPRSTHDGRTSRTTRSVEDQSSWAKRSPACACQGQQRIVSST